MEKQGAGGSDFEAPTKDVHRAQQTAGLPGNLSWLSLADRQSAGL